jgi:hypothetical protein
MLVKPRYTKSKTECGNTQGRIFKDRQASFLLHSQNHFLPKNEAPRQDSDLRWHKVKSFKTETRPSPVAPTAKAKFRVRPRGLILLYFLRMDFVRK